MEFTIGRRGLNTAQLARELAALSLPISGVEVRSRRLVGARWVAVTPYLWVGVSALTPVQEASVAATVAAHRPAVT